MALRLFGRRENHASGPQRLVLGDAYLPNKIGAFVVGDGIDPCEEIRAAVAKKKIASSSRRAAVPPPRGCRQRHLGHGRSLTRHVLEARELREVAV